MRIFVRFVMVLLVTILLAGGLDPLASPVSADPDTEAPPPPARERRQPTRPRHHSADCLDATRDIGSPRDPGLRPTCRHRHPGATGRYSRPADRPDRISGQCGRRPRRRTRWPRRTARQHSRPPRPGLDTLHCRHLRRAGPRRRGQIELRSARPQSAWRIAAPGRRR